ncbi:MAG TPA: HAMP domain-containing protein, partial [Streptosporangiaceae bacterium]|nr:HAMP domain-containing protein [Streptosporangiaceae bacterium]
FRPRIAGDRHGDHTGTWQQDRHEAGTSPAGYDSGPSRRPGPMDPAPANFQPSRPDAPAAPSPATGPGGGPGEQGSRHVRTRLGWLAVIPAVAVTAIALCVAGLAYALSGTRIGSSGSSVRDEAIVGAALLGIVVIVLVLATRATISVARSVLRPLYATRARALALADDRPVSVAPAEVVSPDEIGDIARALERMRAKMAQPASDEASLHGRLDAMFVNLSQRGQSLAERQMRLIEHLENGEQNPERRASLFRMNRIAARMYRNSQNLLVLAGHELSSGWNQPVALMSVIRAAVSEVEENERVSVYAQPEIAVTGPAVHDVVHLLAELVQNATSFSSVDMPVEISGQLLNTGGVLISITDRGVGMSAQEIAYANWRLENPPSADIDVPKWIGLFVVARLAARHSVRVRLQLAEFGGLTAFVWLPDELIVRQDAVVPVPVGLAGSGPGGPRRGAHEAVMGPGGGAGQRSVAAARFAEARLAEARLAEAASEGATQPASFGQALTPDVRRQPGSARAAAGSRPAPPADPARPAAGVHAVSQGRPHETGSVDAVVVPPAGNPAEERRLPIFDAVESHWFEGGRRTSGSSRTVGNRWSSPADEGWRVAKTIETPTTGAPTTAGLPRRLPNANLVPGAIPGAPPAAVPSRSAVEARDRLTGLQRGVAEGRAAASETANPRAAEDS